MIDLRSCTKAGLGFAVLAGLSASVSLGAGGPDPSNPVAIGGLPFADTGSTAGGTDDWDEVCPYTGSTSPDHWYSYTPAGTESVSITLCESAYDTKLYVLDSGFTQVGCVDDSCSSSGGGGFRSNIDNLELTAAGAPYYIVVDGYLGSAGTYDIAMDVYVPPPPCVLDCVGDPEGEPCDDSGIPDMVNGGCNSTPAVFGSVDCNDTVCGLAFGLGGTRDTDWYGVNMTEANLVTMTVTAEAALNIFTLTGVSNGICGAVAVDQQATLVPCEEASISTAYAVGDAYLWVGHSDFDTLPCGQENPGNDYVMTVTCGIAPPTPCCTLGDANEDGDVGFADLLIVLDNWGACPAP